VSRAEVRIPDAPTLGGALRNAASDLYFHAPRLVAANLVVGLLLLGLMLAALSIGWLAAPLVLLLAPPLAGLMRLATRIVREGHAVLSDFTPALRRPWRALLAGSVQLLVAVVLVGDLVIGSGAGGMGGAFLAVSAVYGLAAWWALAVVFWPLLLDPLRASEPLRAIVRLALLLLFAHPLRIGGVAVLLAVVLAVSLVFVAAILTVAPAFAWLLAAHYVLPAADRLEGRATREVLEP
jgi:hypothetical protein